MKKYFLDFEFMEGWRKPVWWLPSIGSFNKKYFTIEMISIGLVCDDGREYFAVNKDFNPRYANDWVKKNVISKLPPRQIGDARLANDFNSEFGYSKVFDGLEDNPVYKSIDKIRNDLYAFLHIATSYHRRGDGAMVQFIPQSKATEEMEFYGYFADYDWVLFCSIFGTMMDLPEGMPRYCNDLKQIFDTGIRAIASKSGESFEDAAKRWKQKEGYPVNNSEHDCLEDAKWNMALYKFLDDAYVI